PKKILEISEKLGVNVLGICDHNTTEGAIQTKKLAKNILVLVGQEIKTEYGDLCIFGTEENLKGTLFEIVDRARYNELFIVFPHPFDRFRRAAMGNNLNKKDLMWLLKQIDAIEVFNSRCVLNSANKKAQEVADEFKIPGIAASDAHTAGELGNARNFLDCELKEEEVYNAIRRNRVQWTGKRSALVNRIL
ncbi:MAG: PHP domain-containing protein, partial [Candidatus Aenigmarchaeota archaeon]|nr:PHP domain-containing protein [Candidatus Aenigmarchaeota archaeon]